MIQNTYGTFILYDQNNIPCLDLIIVIILLLVLMF